MTSWEDERNAKVCRSACLLCHRKTRAQVIPMATINAQRFTLLTRLKDARAVLEHILHEHILHFVWTGQR